MWFIILLAIAIIVFVIMKKKSDEVRAEKERIERERKAAEAKARIAKFETLTDNEKNQLNKYSKEELDVTLIAFNKAIKGDIEAMTMLGYTYNLKLNNSAKSFYWIQKASKAGGTDATFWLGKYYLDGYGVKENRIQGTHLVLEAAKKGSELAVKCLIEDFGMSKSEMRSIGIKV